MWKPKIAIISNARKALALSCLSFAFLYPGHNPLQTIVIHPAPPKSYDLSVGDLPLYPVHDQTPPPYLSARGVIVQDVTSKTILYSRGADLPLSPASTTKIMTAILARDTWEDLSTPITVLNEDRAIGQTINLFQKEVLTLHNMLRGLLIHSGNDAALALADNYEGGYAEFISAMNRKAQDLHLNNTTYRNPSGIDQYGHTTTPRDLAVLAQVAMADPVIAEIVSTKNTQITDLTGQITHDLESTNQLLGVIPGLLGVKTGWTTRSGECLVSYVVRDDHPLVIVILGSSDRFGETASLVEWAYAHHNWITPNL